MNLKQLPDEMIEIIKLFMWGNSEIYKKKLNIIHLLPKYKQDSLRVAEKCRINQIDVEIEDEIYCSKCGEKTLFPFTRIVCSNCDEFI